MKQKRSSFTGKIGFVLAAAGSAVGLGNIWRFPYLAAKYGGGIFLLVYIILAVTFGFALMCAEIALGRRTGKSAIAAFGYLNKKWSFVGWLVALVPVLILPYYSVIGGWITKYISVYLTGNGTAAAGEGFFADFTATTGEPIVWFLIFIGLTALVLLFDVSKGVEQVSKIMMPILILLTVGIAVYIVLLPGAYEGVKYYLMPDFSNFTIATVVAAMGQLFYSMSLAMGIMITYGSYMKKDISIEKSVRQIEVFDTGIAFLAGLMVIPAVFAFGEGGEASLGKGPGLMFVTLPKVFDSFKGGHIIGVAFFIMVFFAALTSSISLMETVISIVRDKTGLGRKSACGIVFAGSVIIGLPSALGFSIWDGIKPLGMDILTFFDFISNSVVMPIVAILTCIFIGYIVRPKQMINEIEAQGATFNQKKLFSVMIKYIAPVFIVLIFIFSLCEAFNIETLFGIQILK
ncbi:MAG: sodium-dependent transporter [Clostridia bacterium]|nr:sodium-dependent transporter [Clostridia bacterium]